MALKKGHKISKTQRRKIFRHCGNMIGLHVGNNNWYKIIDQAKINGVMYLLGVAQDKTHAIYEMIKVDEAILLPPKKLLENRLSFCNKDFWQEHTSIQLDDTGNILLNNSTL